LFLHDDYVALFGINRGLVKVVEIDAKMSDNNSLGRYTRDLSLVYRQQNQRGL
jgi:hypothetical protein